MSPWCADCGDPINGGQRWEMTESGPMHLSCVVTTPVEETCRSEESERPDPAAGGLVPFPETAGSDYARKLEAEAFRRFTGRQRELVHAALRLPELNKTVLPGQWRGVGAAVVRELWGLPWRDIAEAVGYAWPAAVAGNVQRSAKKHPNAVQIIYMLVRECVIDEYLSMRAEVIEEMEMLAEAGVLHRSDDWPYTYRIVERYRGETVAA